ncbi:type I secretion system permease/ATPase [Legionella taurinensis]|uniref:Type I secretion system permease/ATPase n=2 Tax=Legionella taurinensis TaxID=70611 RepID=A0A3A5L2R3_9GAMM|nr:type I secretion system permease/ATPase [Legionella taurinensis]PUT39195.1 type I secretion system permease/ATPase [Legionella taurinensis]PUT39536.1 type I secretion system permease/ATPase [Legionella taurinensis]PUT43961.1 type I secretion system permease/ATPase [Legionella taurinensis]PUT45039.1 type I secretion system permease/ATPase [Legionella taurinensis]RJT45611.1 type I secretion system permease/ATPase [Legionella taurinensis]
MLLLFVRCTYMAPKEKHPLKQTFEASKSAFIYVGLFSLFINVLMLTTPLYMMQVFDRVLASYSYDTLIYLTLIAVLALLILSLLDAVRTYIIIHVSVWFERKLSPPALALSPDQILLGNTYPEHALRDIATVKQFIGGSAVFTFFDSPWVPVYLIVIFMLDPVLGWISTIGALILFLCALLNELCTRKLLRDASEMAINTQQEMAASLRNAEAIQAMGMLPALISAWHKNNEAILHFQIKSSKISGNILALSKFIRSSLQIFILGVGAYLVLTNRITSGMMIAGSILMSRALAPVEQAISAWKQYQSAKHAIDRLKPHLAFQSHRLSGIQLPAPKGHLSVENLYYMPPALQKFVINGITLHIKPGEMAALIGPSAAGKSTLARLIAGVLKPNNGSVRLDTADVYQWERTDFGRYVGYLPQDIELFNGSVKENIARMGTINDAAVIKAAKQAGCHELILRLPQGYDTVIHRNSFGLSGGQRQRIALARALYGDPQLVILDEPNSNLDSDGELALLNALQELKRRQATVILIAHRPHVIHFVDTLIVLNEGKIQFSGPRDQILNKLKELAAAQADAQSQSKGN